MSMSLNINHLAPAGFGVALLCCGLFTTTDATAEEHKFRWSYGGENYSLVYDFDRSEYRYYASQPRKINYRTGQTDYAYYANEAVNADYIEDIAGRIKRAGEGYGFNDWEIAAFTTRFVQSLTYQTDQCLTEYPKYAIETLVDHGGDCEDTAILLTALLENMGYDCVLVSPPGHMAAGLATSDRSANFTGPDGQDYYYIETTSTRYGIGELPREYQNQRIRTFEVEAAPRTRPQPQPQTQRQEPQYSANRNQSCSPGSCSPNQANNQHQQPQQAYRTETVYTISFDGGQTVFTFTESELQGLLEYLNE